MHPLLPGTVLPVTTGIAEEAASIEPAADQTLDPILRLHGQQPRRASALQQPRDRHTLGHTLWFGLLGRKASSTRVHGPRIGLVGLSFLTSQKSSIVQQLMRVWQRCHSSRMSLLPSDLPHGLLLHRDHLLLILLQTDPMMRPWLMILPTSVARQVLEAIQ